MDKKLLKGVLSGLMVAGLTSTAYGMGGSEDRNMELHHKHANPDYERCSILDKDGKSMIKENKSDCAFCTTHPCEGGNKAGDPEAFVFLPKGTCDKIEGGVIRHK